MLLSYKCVTILKLYLPLQKLSGWELSYLKMCCKVQGVKKDLIGGRTLPIVSLNDLKSYFPKRTEFTENCWPQAKSKSLLPKQYNNPYQSHVAPISVPRNAWTRSLPNESFPNYTAATKPHSNTPMIMPSASNVVVSSTPQPMTMTRTIIVSSSQLPSTSLSMRTLGPGPRSTMTLTTSRKTPIQISAAPPPRQLATNSNPTNYQNNGHYMMTPEAGAAAMARSAKSSEVSKIKVNNAPSPQDRARLRAIPPHVEGSKDGAYVIRYVSFFILN